MTPTSIGQQETLAASTEARRLDAARKGTPWRRWGPYLNERQWGTVREDYSENGDAWGYFPHDHARSRAYRWRCTILASASAMSRCRAS